MSRKKAKILQSESEYQRKIKPPNPKNDAQADFIQSINDNSIIFCNGCAGTGKTHIAVGCAVERLLEGAVEKILIARPAVETDEKLGFLPGDIQSKLNYYLLPIYDELLKFAKQEEIKKWELEKKLEIVPVGLARGRSFHNSFIIIDEAQNLTFQQLKMLITRIGFYSKMILVGDSEQSDLPLIKRGAFKAVMDDLADLEQIGSITLPRSGIIRNPIIEKILPKLDELEKTLVK